MSLRRLGDNTSAWVDLLTNYNGTNISYDSIGNPTNWIGISSLSWDGRELDNITISNNHTVDYTYNSDGIRTRKYEFNGNEQYLYDHRYVLDGSTIVKETIRYSSAFYGDSTTTLEYYYDESGIASFRYNGTLYYYVKNLQGDVIGIMDNSGAVVVEYTYDAWGNILSVTGSLASTVGQINPFRYRGYYYDSETGWYYLNSRYYDAEIGRFINADAFIGANGGLQGYNMFAYCNNSPVMFYDPSGCMGEINEENFDYQDPFNLFPECMDGGCGTVYYDYLLDSSYRNYLVRSNCAAYDASRGGYHSNNVSSAYSNPFDYIVPGAVSVTDDMAVPSTCASSQVTNGKVHGNRANSEKTTYQAPPGGGGVTNKVTIGETTVTFGHGGRHLSTGIDVSRVEQSIANNVVNRTSCSSSGKNIPITIDGLGYEYSYKVIKSNFINVGTYHPVDLGG